jgi:hypothetical protein
MSKGREEYCYLCKRPVMKYQLEPGQPPPTDMRTRDHLPPENLFPEGARRDLITVTCCYAWNKGFSKLDEQFRVFVTTALNVSQVGTQVMREKVFGSSLKKSPKLKQQMARDVFLGEIMTALGPMAVPLIAMNREMLNGFFIRLTKGLLATFYSDIDYFALCFSVTQLNQFGATKPAFKSVISLLKHDQRGDGVFRFWHGVAQEQRTTGMWIYQFYDAALFMVKHSKEPWPENLAKGSLP